jgi:hypothetical protein
MAATDEDLCGGFFSRIIFCAPDYQFVIPTVHPGDPPLVYSLLKILRRWRSKESGIAVSDPGVSERLLDYGYAITPYTRGQAIDITQPEDQIASVTYVRYSTFATKVAILLAASESPDFDATLHVTLRHAVLAIALVDRFRRYAIRLLRYIEKSDPSIVDAEKLLAKIRRDPGRDRSHYQRAMKWGADRFSLAISELENSRRVEWEDQPSTGGRKSRIYFAK